MNNISGFSAAARLLGVSRTSITARPAILAPTTYKKSTLGAQFSVRHQHAQRIYTAPPRWGALKRTMYPKTQKRAGAQKRAMMPDAEGDESVAQALPHVEYELPVKANFGAELGLFIPHKPRPVAEQVLDPQGHADGRGRRKTCWSHAWVRPGTGRWNINGRPSLLQYFPQQSNRDIVLHPLLATETVGQWDVRIAVRGGGHRAQAEASRMALSHAVANYDGDLRAPLAKARYFKRDLRRVERKKPGQKKARKKFQWVKR